MGSAWIVTNRLSRVTNKIKSVILFTERKEKFSFRAIMRRMATGKIRGTLVGLTHVPQPFQESSA
jgi:hypothetical protein